MAAAFCVGTTRLARASFSSCCTFARRRSSCGTQGRQAGAQARGDGGRESQKQSVSQVVGLPLPPSPQGPRRTHLLQELGVCDQLLGV